MPERKIKYKGGGFLVGVPARDLTEDEHAAAVKLHGAEAVDQLYEKPAPRRKKEVIDGK